MFVMPAPCLDDLRALRKDQVAWSRVKGGKRGREGPESIVFGNTCIEGDRFNSKRNKKEKKKTKEL